MDTPALSGIMKLPESAHCFEVMEKRGMIKASAEGSDLMPHEFFESTMGLERDTLRYKTQIMCLRDMLIDRGLYLAERGNQGKGYTLIPIPSTEAQIRLWEKKIISTRCRQIRLSRAVLAQHSHLLTQEQKLKLQKQAENSARMLAFEANAAMTKQIMDENDEKIRGNMTARAERQITRRLAGTDD